MSAGRKSETTGAATLAAMIRSFAGLPRGCDFAAEKTRRLALVIEGLPVASRRDQPFTRNWPLRSQNGIGIQLAKEKIQACQAGYAGSGSVHGGEHGLLELFSGRSIPRGRLTRG